MRDIARKAKHSNRRGREYGRGAASRIAERGRQISAKHAIKAEFDEPIELLWSQSVSFPFSWAGSKNHIFSARADGHATLRAEANSYRSALTAALKSSIKGQRVAQNKLWIDIMIQKPSHRGDAANLLDMICDAVKDAVGLDDRWFSIRRLDWQIVKTAPVLLIRIGQQTAEDVQACSACGRLLPFSCFHANKGQRSGVGRQCRDCSSARPARKRI